MNVLNTSMVRMGHNFIFNKFEVRKAFKNLGMMDIDGMYHRGKKCFCIIYIYLSICVSCEDHTIDSFM